MALQPAAGLLLLWAPLLDVESRQWASPPVTCLSKKPMGSHAWLPIGFLCLLHLAIVLGDGSLRTLAWDIKLRLGGETPPVSIAFFP